MSAHRPRRGPHPRAAARQAAARLRRAAAALAALTCALLASAAIIPAAWAVNVIPPGGGDPRGGRPGGRRRHGRLADHRDRARRRPGRGHRGRDPGPDTGRPPGRHRRVTRPARPRGQQPRPDFRPEPGHGLPRAGPAATTHDPQTRPSAFSTQDQDKALALPGAVLCPGQPPRDGHAPAPKILICAPTAAADRYHPRVHIESSLLLVSSGWPSFLRDRLRRCACRGAGS